MTSNEEIYIIEGEEGRLIGVTREQYLHYIFADEATQTALQEQWLAEADAATEAAKDES